MGNGESSSSSSGSEILNIAMIGGVVILLGIGGYALYTIIDIPLTAIKDVEETARSWWDDVHFLPNPDPVTGAPATTGEHVGNAVTWTLFPLPKIIYQIFTGEGDKGNVKNYKGNQPTTPNGNK